MPVDEATRVIVAARDAPTSRRVRDWTERDTMCPLAVLVLGIRRRSGRGLLRER
jgi:hypothetical protein